MADTKDKYSGLRRENVFKRLNVTSDLLKERARQKLQQQKQEEVIQKPKSDSLQMLKNLLGANPISLKSPQDIIEEGNLQRPGKILRGEGTTADILSTAKTGALPKIIALKKLLTGVTEEPETARSVEGITREAPKEYVSGLAPDVPIVESTKEPETATKRILDKLRNVRGKLGFGDELNAPREIGRTEIKKPQVYDDKRPFTPAEEREAISGAEDLLKGTELEKNRYVRREMGIEKKKFTPVPFDFINTFGHAFFNTLLADPLKFFGGVSSYPLNKITGTRPEDNILYKTGVGISKHLEEASKINPNVRDMLGVQMFQGFGSTAGFIAGAFLTKGANLPPSVSVALLGGMTQAGQEFENAYNVSGSEKKALQSGIIGILLGATEAAPIARFLDRLGRFAKTPIKQIILESFKQGFEEGAQEMFQQFGKNLTAKQLYDASRDLKEGVLEGGEVGFLTGLLMSGLGSAGMKIMNDPNATKQEKKYAQKLVDLESEGIKETLTSIKDETKKFIETEKPVESEKIATETTEKLPEKVEIEGVEEAEEELGIAPPVLPKGKEKITSRKEREGAEEKPTTEGAEITPKQERRGIKAVWRRNKEGGQEIGNKQIIVKPTLEQFRDEILPRSRKGFYKGKTPEAQFKDFEAKNEGTDNPTVISLIDTGEGWKVDKVDGMNEIYNEIQVNKGKDWVKEVDDLNSKDATDFRKIADSELKKEVQNAETIRGNEEQIPRGGTTVEPGEEKSGKNLQLEEEEKPKPAETEQQTQIQHGKEDIGEVREESKKAKVKKQKEIEPEKTRMDYAVSMTKAEFEKADKESKIPWDSEFAGSEQIVLIKKAQKEGKTVPENILKDYPELKGETEKSEEIKETTVKEKKSVSQGEKVKKTEAFGEVELSAITKDLKNYQGRQGEEYSEQTYNRILNEEKEGKFVRSSMPPILVYERKNGTFELLAGHSRLAAFESLAKANDDFKTIPTQFIRETDGVTFEQAKKIAQESNQGAVQKVTDNALYFRKIREGIESTTEIRQKAKDLYGNNATYIIELSYLNPKGKTFQSLVAMAKAEDKDTQERLGTVASWVGAVRQRISRKITDSHENEMFDYLMDEKNYQKFKLKSGFIDKITDIVENPEYDRTKPLNLPQTAELTTAEREYKRRLNQLAAELKEKEAELKSRRNELVGKQKEKGYTNEDINRVLEPVRNEIIAIEQERDELQKQEGKYKQAGESEIGLFGGPTVEPKKVQFAETDDEKQKVLDEIDRLKQEAIRKSGIGDKGTEGNVMFQKELTESSPFKKWFGDSKVVDENGKPLVVYHGTGKNFTEFDKNKLQFFFTDDPEIASLYSKSVGSPNIMPVYLKIKRPFVKDYDKEYYAVPDIAADIEEAIKNNNDGLILYNTENVGNIYIALEPTQIKSATGNVGTFDASNPNILFQKDETEGIEPENLQILADHLTFNYIKLGNFRIQQVAERLIDDGLPQLLPYLKHSYKNFKAGTDVSLPVLNSLDDEKLIEKFDPEKFREGYILSTYEGRTGQTEGGLPASEGERVSGRPAVSPADRGEGGRGRPPLRYANTENLPEITKEHVVKGKYDVDEHQRYGINLALQRFLTYLKKAFLLADGTGVGKTREELVIADQVKKQTGGKILIVTESTRVIKESFVPEARRTNIALSDFEVGSYTELRDKKIGTGQYALAIFDESHNLKNIDSGKSDAARKVKTERYLYATATPMDQVTQAAYYLADITDRPLHEITNELGFNIVEQKDFFGARTRYVSAMKPGITPDMVVDNVLKLRNEAIKNGAMIRREYPFYGEIKEKNLGLDADTLTKQTMIDEFYQQKIDWIKKQVKYGRISREEGKGIMMAYGSKRKDELWHLTEPLKAEYVFQQTVKDLEAGKQVVIVGSFYSESVLSSIGGNVEAFIPIIERKLTEAGIKFGRAYGSKEKRTMEGIDDFQAGDIKVLVMTTKTGGIGINLDDVVGDAPRSVYVASPDYAGDVFDQLKGRFSRRNTKSPGEVHLIYFSDSIVDTKRKDILNRKLRTLYAIQKGEDIETGGIATDVEGLGPEGNIMMQKDIEKSRKQIHTKNFKDWFGDWQNDPENASKVVDAEGKPLVVYHGTGDFYNDIFKKGLNYFSSADYATLFAGLPEWGQKPQLLPVYLNIKNPLDITDLGIKKISAKKFINYLKSKNIKLNEAQEEALLSDSPDEPWFYLNRSGMFLVTNIKNAGFDGIVQLERIKGLTGSNKSYITFEPTQIKSATGNKGIFSPTNPNILQQKEEFTTNRNVYLKALQEEEIRLQKRLETAEWKMDEMSEYDNVSRRLSEVRREIYNVQQELAGVKPAEPEFGDDQMKLFAQTDRGINYKRVGADYLHAVSKRINRNMKDKGVKWQVNENAEIVKVLNKKGYKSITEDDSPRGFFDMDTKIAHLNADKATEDTPVHEFGHGWLGWIKSEHVGFYKAGLKLMSEDEAMMEQILIKYPEQEFGKPLYGDYSEKALNEGLAHLIGYDGADIISGMIETEDKLYAKKQSWLRELWNYIQEWFNGIFGTPAKPVRRMTLGEFTKMAARDIVEGTGITADEKLMMNAINAGRSLNLRPFDYAQGVPFSRGQFAEPFYSQLERVAGDKVSNNSSPEQVLKTLRNNGVKEDEIKWMGLEEWMGSRKDAKVAKNELMEFIANNKLVVEEKVLGENNLAGLEKQWEKAASDVNHWVNSPKNKRSDKDFEKEEELRDIRDSLRDQIDELKTTPNQETKFSQWQLPGGENYREWLFKVAEIEYEEPHYHEKGIIAHGRGNDRILTDGKKMLFIEEVQSQLHQTGRKAGYGLPAEDKFTIDIVEKTGDKFYQAFVDGTEYLWPVENHTRAEFRLWVRSKIGAERVPNAPMKKTWHEFVLKNLIRKAAEEGYDAVGWTLGKDQIDRYNEALRQNIDKLIWFKNADDKVNVQGQKKGVKSFDEIIPLEGTTHIAGKTVDLEDVVGKRIAKQIREDIAKDEIDGVFEGENLAIGGEGMQVFYDEMLPNFVNKYVKKWGGKVEDGEVKTKEMSDDMFNKYHQTYQDDYRDSNFQGTFTKWMKENHPDINTDEYKPIHSLTITPEMKADVLYKGQAMFQKAKLTTEEQRSRQIYTPEFKKWFGDWEKKDATESTEVSKVVDAEGKPLVVYHYTSATVDFNRFKRRMNDIGIHFGTMGQANDRYAYMNNRVEGKTNQRIFPVYLKINKPLRIEDVGWFDGDNVAWGLKETGLFTETELKYARSQNAGQWTKNLRELIESKGFDGMVYKNTGEVSGSDVLNEKRMNMNLPSKERNIAEKQYQEFIKNNAEDSYIAFHPTQIKSATGNRGTFDAGNPNILFQKDGVPPPPEGFNVRKNLTISDKMFDKNIDKLVKIGAKVIRDNPVLSREGRIETEGRKDRAGGPESTPKTEFKTIVNGLFSNSTKKPFVLSDEQAEKLYNASVKKLADAEKEEKEKAVEFEKRTEEVFSRKGAKTAEVKSEKGEGTVNELLKAAGIGLSGMDNFFEKFVGGPVRRKIEKSIDKIALIRKLTDQFGTIPDKEAFKELWSEMNAGVQRYKQLAKEIGDSLYYRNIAAKEKYLFVEQRKLEQLIRGGVNQGSYLTIEPNEQNGLKSSIRIDLKDLNQRAERVKKLTIELKKLGEMYEVLPVETYNTKLPRKRIHELLTEKAQFEAELQGLIGKSKKAEGKNEEEIDPLVDEIRANPKFRPRTKFEQKVKKLVDEIDIRDRKVKNSFKKGQEGYFKRVYLTKEQERTLRKYGYIKPTRLDLTSAMYRTDIPVRVRVRMGEILTAAYPVAKSILLEGKDISIGRFFEAVAENPAWASESAVEGWTAVDKNNKKLGKLKGMWVEPEVWKHLDEIAEMSSQDYSEKFLKQITQMWKQVKVPMNPPTAFRNFYTAVIMCDMYGTTIFDQMRFLPEAIREMRGKGKYAAQLDFLRGSTYVAGELEKFLDIFEEYANRETGGWDGFKNLSRTGKFLKMLGLATLVDTRVGKGARWLYQGNEVLFKTILFLHSKEKGQSDSDAIKMANKVMYDYNDIPRWLLRFRESIFGMPFVTWTWKTIPRMIEASITRPIGFWKYPVMFYAITQYALAALGMTDDEWEDIKRDLPDRMKLGQWMLIPWRDRDGQIQLLDLTFIMPYNDIYQLAISGYSLATTGESPTGAFLVETLGNIMMNPVFTTSAEIATNYNRYTRHTIWNDADKPGEKYLKAMDYIYKMWMPSWYPEIPGMTRGGYVYDKLRSAITKRPDYYGRVFDIEPAVTSAIFGLKVNPVSQIKNIDDQIKKRNGKLSDLYQKKAATLRDDSLTKEKRLEKSAEIDEEIGKLKKEVEDYEKEKTPTSFEGMLLDKYIRELQRKQNELKEGNPEKERLAEEINSLKIDLDVLVQERFVPEQIGIEEVKQNVIKKFDFSKLFKSIKRDIEEGIKEDDNGIIKENRDLLKTMSEKRGVPEKHQKEALDLYSKFDKYIGLREKVYEINKVFEESGLKQIDGKFYQYKVSDQEEKDLKIDKMRVLELLSNRQSVIERQFRDKKITKEERKIQRQAALDAWNKVKKIK
jgi:hypothetical protein